MTVSVGQAMALGVHDQSLECHNTALRHFEAACSVLHCSVLHGTLQQAWLSSPSSPLQQMSQSEITGGVQQNCEATG